MEFFLFARISKELFSQLISISFKEYLLINIDIIHSNPRDFFTSEII